MCGVKIVDLSWEWSIPCSILRLSGCYSISPLGDGLRTWSIVSWEWFSIAWSIHTMHASNNTQWEVWPWESSFVIEGNFRTSGLPRWLGGEESGYQCSRLRRWEFNPWVGKIPWRRKWQPTPLFLPGKSHGQRSLVAYNSWGPKESDTTWQINNANCGFSWGSCLPDILWEIPSVCTSL